MKNVNRRWLSLALALMLGALTVIPGVAAAVSSIYGSTGSTTTFYVKVSGSGAYIELYADSKGKAYVQDYSVMKAEYDGYSTEKHYGFFDVQVSGGSYSKTFYWVPSASYTMNLGDYQDQNRFDRTIRIEFPGSGDYTVSVVPMNANRITGYWYYDRFQYWISDATWKLKAEKNCTASYSNPTRYTSGTVLVKCYAENGSQFASYTETLTGSKTISPRSFDGFLVTSSGQYVTFNPNTGTCDPSTVSFYYRSQYTSGSVSVRCYDEYGSLIKSYTTSITSSQYLYPDAISNYTSTSGSQYVSFNASTGRCDPSTVHFYYQKNQPVQPPAQTHGKVTPSSWDTQFKPGYCRDDNSKQYKDLYKLHDDNSNTAFWWVIWKTERTDSIPEITAYFNRDTISTIGIRNGRLGKYTQYARVACFRVCIYHDGGVSTTYVRIPDVESYSYQTFSLGRTYTGVSRIELFLEGGDGEGFYSGSKEKYYLYISDIEFSN